MSPVPLVHLGGSRDAAITLCVLPAAGAGPSQFRPWATLLPRGMRLMAVLYPGHERDLGHTPMTSMPALVTGIAESLAGLRCERLALFGHSFGGQLAYEAALLLTRQHRAPLERLFVSAIRAPQLPARCAWSLLPDAAFIGEVCRIAQIDPALMADEEMRALLLPMLRADFAMAESYRGLQQQPLQIPVTALYGEQDSEVSRADVAAWRRHCASGFDLHGVRGRHLYVVDNARQAMDAVCQALRIHRPRATAAPMPAAMEWAG